ncbi:MAG TPA: AmmeMemoRadiSam system protein A [bacterium]|nr:AmmeMemoRadiSam system protein A [bacterium]
MLNEQEKIELLRLARSTLEAYLKERRFPRIEPSHARLKENGGAFVTLERFGELRGCIGHLAADKPLSLTVQEMAIEAATGDPRFGAVTEDELPDLEIEISVLADFRKIRDVSEIRIGEHGLIVGDGRRRGLLLPQVAAREGWDVPTFLSATCRKAGLPMDAWRKGGIVIETFTAEVFSEKDLPE